MAYAFVYFEKLILKVKLFVKISCDNFFITVIVHF